MKDQGALCRHCNSRLTICLADLGLMPIANDLPDTQNSPTRLTPLKVMVCSHCRLAQTIDYKEPDEIFRDDYVYFSSESASWVEHARRYVDDMIARFDLAAGARHVEIASNDGYLLQFSQARGLQALGVEPCGSVADAARARDIETWQAFFDVELADKLVSSGGPADLVTANNVFAHIPDVNGFARGIRKLLKPTGVATIEVQHLLRLMQRNQFDTMYHEHFSYHSLIAAARIFRLAGLRVFDVEELGSHGGSIRFFVCRDDADYPVSPNVVRIMQEELDHGLDQDEVYLRFASQIETLKSDLVDLVSGLRAEGKRIIAYGAPAKGVTLLNYCGIGADAIDFTVDRAPSKQGKFLPGVDIPILHPSAIIGSDADYIMILPWNLSEEIMTQVVAASGYRGAFIVPMPTPHVVDAMARQAAA
jgi:SAM-dependent methyltransferase